MKRERSAMVQSVNLNQYQNPQTYASKEHKPKTSAQNPSFGYEEQSPTHPVKKLALTLANDAFGLVGINLILWKIQDLVNGKILVGKINKHFTKNITNHGQLANLAQEMKNDKYKLDKVEMFIGEAGTEGQAFFEHERNIVVVGKELTSTLFHELGHAVIENKTKIMKTLQRGRNNYTWISLALYTMISQRPKNNYEDKGQGPIAKAKNFLAKNEYIIPLLAFSPELITEARASQIGIKFLAEKVKEGKLEKSILKNIKKSYLTCFSTYLFIPVSIMLIDALRNSVNKKVKNYN